MGCDSVAVPASALLQVSKQERGILILAQQGRTMQHLAAEATSHQSSFLFWGHFVKMNSRTALLQQAPVLELEQPSSEPYHLKAGTNAPSYSQYKQDQILMPILGQLGKGFFVESG